MIAHLSKIFLEVFGIVYSISGNAIIDTVILTMIYSFAYTFAFAFTGWVFDMLGWYNSGCMSLFHWVVRIPIVIYGSYGISKLIELFDINIIL